MYELRFHGETRRWRVYDGAKAMYPLHCGDAMLIELGGCFIRQTSTASKTKSHRHWRFRIHRQLKWLMTIFNVPTTTPLDKEHL